jgi:hypothetical protein
MPKHTARLVLFSLAFAWIWLMPALARAALVPVCDAQAVASTLPRSPEPVCAVVVTTIDDETGETTVAPICDPRGASAIAPQRILPVSDASLEATPECGDDSSATAVTSRSDDSPNRAQSFIAGEIGIPIHFEVPNLLRRAVMVVPAEFAAEIGGPRAGIDRSVYHPPR